MIFSQNEKRVLLYKIMYLFLCVICALLSAKVRQIVLNIAIQDLISKCTKPRKIGLYLTLIDKTFQITECSSPVCRTKEKPETTTFQGFFFCLFSVLCVVCALLILILEYRKRAGLI